MQKMSFGLSSLHSPSRHVRQGPSRCSLVRAEVCFSLVPLMPAALRPRFSASNS